MSANLREDVLNLPAFFRGQIRPLLPERAFLRRDREAALFVTNAPKFTDASALIDHFQVRGFICTAINDRLRISPGPAHITDFELRHDPPDHLCKSLVRFRGQEPSADAVALFARGVQLIENADPGRLTEYMKQTRQLSALSLRIRQGGAYACALISHILETERSNPS